MQRLLSVLVVAFVVLAAPARAELTVVSEQQLDAQLAEVTVATDALVNPVRVRILLPASYGQEPDRRYPVLYLLHGAGESAASWSDKGRADDVARDEDVIVVMPEGGRDGWYTNWINEGRRGPPQWRRFHVDQLVAWVDATYRTVDARGARGIAGASMGGLGALNYARSRPDLFGWAASFSGALDITAPTFAGQILLWNLQRVGRPFPQFGDPFGYDWNWRGHNPLLRAAELRGVRVVLTTGNGYPGPLDPPYSFIDPGEVEIRRATLALHWKLDAAGIEHAFRDYGNARHAWPYWTRELERWLPDFLARVPAGA